ncbi:MAG: metallophosphoesterase, partial [Caldilinea sp.]
DLLVHLLVGRGVDDGVLLRLADESLLAVGAELEEVDAGDDGLWLAGVEDVWGGRPDLSAALRDVPADATTLLMSHSPDYFDNVIQRNAPIVVQFSGHTHGGQVRLPRLTPGPDGLFSHALIIPEYGKRYPIGLRRVGDRIVYTNRGLGSWPIPYRFNCPPEITVFTLQQA